MNLKFLPPGVPDALYSPPLPPSDNEEGVQYGDGRIIGAIDVHSVVAPVAPVNEIASASGFVLPAEEDTTTAEQSEENTTSAQRSTLLLVLAGLGVLGLAMSVLLCWFLRGKTLPVGAFLMLSLCGAASAGACVAAIKHAGNSWITRTRIGWSSIAIACGLYAMGCLVYAFLRRKGMVATPSVADWFWMAEQPFLWVGLFLLAWRGRSMGLMRLLTDTLIVMLAAMVLLWSLVLQEKLFDGNMTLFAKSVLLYYPMFDIAHLFCVMMLLANLSGRPALSRASWFLFGGIVSLIASDALASLTFSGGGHHPLWLDALQGWSVLLIGMAAVVNAYSPRHADSTPLSGAEEAVEAAPRAATSLKTAPLDEALARWHRSAMLWLPYLVTLSVSCILIGKEFFGSHSQSVQHLMPVLALLMAIAARQMLTLWDNLQLAERLRASNADLEINVNERTRHLATLHGITSTLNTSLDRRTILRVTLERIITATGADAGGIWLREVRRDVYEGNAPHDEWTLMHWQGSADPAMPSLLRDLSIAEAAEGEGMSHETFHLSPATRDAMHAGVAPPRQRLILVPVRWQGYLMGVMGLMRQQGAFTYEDRALVESVALEAGAALQNARMYSEAAHRADRDSVTDLFNHRAVQEQMTATLGRCKRSGGVFSIVMMDLNNFKFFNDTYGHPVGDDVLRTVARGLRESCRGSDILGRYGGDEFIVVLPDTDAASTLDVCGRIKATLDAKHFEPVPGTKLPIGTAFGWAAYPGDGETIMDLLSAADANLYNHKRGGASYLSQTQKALQEGRDEMKKLKSRAHGGSFGVLDALVTAIDNKDHYTRHHSEEVTYLSLLVARELDYNKEQLEAVRISGLLHDVGKIAVPDQILRHPGKLGRDEWDIMQQHPVFGALIVKDVPHLERVIDGIKYHHEKWDGSGYPEKRVAEDIPEMGRLLAMGDCYSALTTDRPYRKGWTPDAALEEIERCAGTHFDPRLCAIFLHVMRRELAIGGDTQDYGTRIAEDFGAERRADITTKVEFKAKAEAEAQAEETTKAEAAVKAKVAAEEKVRAEAQAKARAEEARVWAEMEAKAKVQAEIEAKALAEARAKAEEERVKAEEAVLAKAASEAKALAEEAARVEVARIEAEAKARAEAEARIKAQAEAKAEEARVKAEAEKKALAEEKARIEAQARVKAETAERVRAESEDRARAEKARIQVEAEAKALAEAKIKAEAEVRAKAEEARVKALAEAQAKAEAEAAKVKAEIEDKARAEAKAQEARIEAEAKAKAEAEEKVRVEAEEARAKAEARTKAEEEARARAQAEVLAKAEAEAQAKIRAEIEANAKAEVKAEEARIRAETEEKAETEARALAEVRAKAEAEEEARVQTEAKAKAKEAEAEKEARIKSWAQAQVEVRTRIEAEIRAKVEAETDVFQVSGRSLGIDF